MSTLSEVKAYVRYWKPVLRLKDWEINYKIETDSKKFDFAGQMTMYPQDQAGVLSVLDPEKIPEEWRGCKDLEVTVVHELLHARLLFCEDRSKSKHWHLEMAIETIAKALVATRRGITPEELV